MWRIDNFNFNNLKIRNKLALVLSGTVAMLTGGMLAAVLISTDREVERDVSKDLSVAVDSVVMQEETRLNDAVLRAGDIAESAPASGKAAGQSSGCRWAEDQIQNKSARAQFVNSLELVALESSSGALDALAVEGQPPCDPQTMRWQLPRLKHSDKPTITNWESKRGDFYEMVEVPVTGYETGRTLVLGFRVSDYFAKRVREYAIPRNQADDGTGVVFWHFDAALPHVLGASDTKVGAVMEAELGKRSAASKGKWPRLSGYSVRQPDKLEIANVDYDNPEKLSMVVLQPLAPHFAPFRRLEWTMGGIGVVMLVAGIVAGIFLSHPITSPLVSLAFVADEVAKGDLDAAHRLAGRDPARTTSLDEIGVLSRSFLEMVKGLRERRSMSPFLSKEFLEYIQRQGFGTSEIQIDRRSLVVLFSDIRNFTDFSETEDPALVIELLNEVLSLQTCIVERHGGDINKFIGDALFAWFAGEDRCARAIDAANEMIAALDARFKGRAGTMVGIGIHVGDTVIGSVGSPNRKDYTAIGAVVNLASRLCSNAALGQILISEAVGQELAASAAGGRLHCKPLRPIHLKGFAGMMPIYEANQIAATSDAPATERLATKGMPLPGPSTA